MIFDTSRPIAHFLDGTAARQPAPGGGSVTALAGALAAAIGEMVLNYSLDKKGLEAHQEVLRESLQELHRARQMMLALMVDDQTAYQALTEIRKLPKDSAEYREHHPAALLASIRTPEAIAATALAILEICDRLVDRVNYFLLSDLAVCGELAMATVRCGIYNVRVNLTGEHDPKGRQNIEQTLDQMLARATSLVKTTIPRIWARHASGK